MSKSNHSTHDKQPAARHLAEIIVIKGLGYLLLLLGIAALVTIGLQGWELYEQPEGIERFATALAEGVNIDEIPVAVYRLAAWQVVVVLLLALGKIASWLIEAGSRLV